MDSQWISNVPIAEMEDEPELITGLGVGALTGTELCVGGWMKWMPYLKGFPNTHPCLPFPIALCLMHLSLFLVNYQYPFNPAI
jgi:hypothetical protein